MLQTCKEPGKSGFLNFMPVVYKYLKIYNIITYITVKLKELFIRSFYFSQVYIDFANKKVIYINITKNNVKWNIL